LKKTLRARATNRSLSFWPTIRCFRICRCDSARQPKLSNASSSDLTGWMPMPVVSLFNTTMCLPYVRPRDFGKPKLCKSLSAAAAKLNDARSKAYALVSAVQLSPLIGLYTADTFDSLSHEALTTASNLNDPYLQFLVRHAIVKRGS
jgi:hypothetical protein